MTIEGWLGFSRLNLHVRILFTCGVVCVWAGKWLLIMMQFLLTKGNVSLFILLDGHSFTACDEACPACGTCTQLSLYTESDLVPHVPSFPLFATRLIMQHSIWSRILLANDRSQFKSDLRANCFRGMLSYMHCYTQCVITTWPHRVRVATIEIWFTKNCRTYEIWGLKTASKAIS